MPKMPKNKSIEHRAESGDQRERGTEGRRDGEMGRKRDGGMERYK